ncbi:unnamed protein product [Spirodela intermedia]|uniref:Uncharacterized protein n=1 Tax=Spirodela intermedia TaxID=51605 RepID=A0A7I8KFY0_SPIIN|nr:unnamed protein product [Spirodela intermedia]
MGEGFSWLKLLAVALAVMLSLGQWLAAAAAEETIKKSMFLCPFPGGCKPPVKSRPPPGKPVHPGLPRHQSVPRWVVCSLILSLLQAPKLVDSSCSSSRKGIKSCTRSDSPVARVSSLRSTS